ncbi:hypothetical protein SCANM63S_07264 [Streptomyces canarius]
MAAQWSASVPLLLPIACEYSHWISGLVCCPDSAWARHSSSGAYMGQAMSDATSGSAQPRLAAPSYWIGRVGSCRRTQPAAASWLAP